MKPLRALFVFSDARGDFWIAVRCVLLSAFPVSLNSCVFLNILMHLKEHLHPRVHFFLFSLCDSGPSVLSCSPKDQQIFCLQKPNVLLGNSLLENPQGLAAASAPQADKPIK